MRSALLLLLLILIPRAALAEARSVLLFVPEDSTFPWIADFTRSFRQTLGSEWPEPVTVDVEYLDMAWFREDDGQYQRALLDFYFVKYRRRRPDAIVALVDATPLMVYLQQQLWPEVPCLSVFNDEVMVATLSQGPHLRGNWADLDISGTAQLAVRVLPDTQRIALVLGSSPREVNAISYVSQEIRAAAPGREVIELTGLTLEELRRRVHALPEHTVVLLVGFNQDTSGRAFVSGDVLQLLHTDGGPPLFSVHKTMLGRGLLGGILLDYQRLGQEMARRTSRLFTGELASSLPPGAIDVNAPAFDARELARWGIPESRLPPGSEVAFREPGFWERYRWQLTVIIGAGVLQGALIVVLLVERRRRMGAQRLNLAVLDSFPGAVAILDPNGTVLRASPPTGTPLAPGSSFLETFRAAAHAEHPEAEGAAAVLEDVLAARAREGMVDFQGSSPGTWFELRARHLELPEGGAVVSLVDVTPRKRAEQEARQARDERAHMERVAVVGELGVSIAHELNQPLAAIRFNAEAAQRYLRRTPPDVARVEDILQDIIADDQRAGEVIRHLRELLKKSEATRTPHDLNTLVQEVARLVGNDALLRKIHLVVRPSESPLFIQGDGVQLRQVVLNLTLNALDAVEGCAPGQRRVWLRTGLVKERVELVVEDSGVGLTDEALRRVFEPFFTTKAKGLGMGLSISRSILEGHQGRLQAERREGGGAVFRCTFPAA